MERAKMNKFQKTVAVILSLPYPCEEKLSLIRNLVAVVDNDKILDFNIQILIDEIDKKQQTESNKKNYSDEDKKAIESIRSKLTSLLEK
ncbi:MAG: hypothetical protein NTZ55_04385 [Candidatus Roizmanbacteria bacterium]|nr:hypothetical protein [Candidatus Roizmanbacteria bacterium]